MKNGSGCSSRVGGAPDLSEDWNKPGILGGSDGKESA